MLPHLPPFCKRVHPSALLVWPAAGGAGLTRRPARLTYTPPRLPRQSLHTSALTPARPASCTVERAWWTLHTLTLLQRYARLTPYASDGSSTKGQPAGLS